MVQTTTDSLTSTVQSAAAIAEILRRNPLALEAYQLSQDFHAYVCAAWSEVESAEFIDNWHIKAICQHLQAVSEGKITNLLINVPPGMSKSLITSVFWPTWEWTRDPSLRMLYASYDEQLSTRDSVKCRTLITSKWYLDRWPKVRLVADQNQKTRYSTVAGGYRISTSLPEGHGTGEHPDRIVVDDPHNVRKAESEAERKAVIEWWDLTMPTRGASRGVRRVVIMQRLHQGDLSGHILKSNENDRDWDIIILPMRREPDRMKPTSLGWIDPRTSDPSIPSLISPRQFSETVVRKIERSLGSYGTAGQLQQRPAPREGGMFRPVWFGYVDATPVKARWCRAWDFASTADDGDWTVGLLMCRSDEGLFYVADVIREQCTAHQRDLIVYRTAMDDGKNVKIIIEQEPGAAGVSLIDYMVRMLQGWIVRPYRPTGPKEVRAEAYAAQAEAGNVKLVRANWNREYLSELAVFPMGDHDDQVDSSSMAFHTLARGGRWLVAGGGVMVQDTSIPKPLNRRYGKVLRRGGKKLGRPSSGGHTFGRMIQNGFSNQN